MFLEPDEGKDEKYKSDIEQNGENDVDGLAVVESLSDVVEDSESGGQLNHQKQNPDFRGFGHHGNKRKTQDADDGRYNAERADELSHIHEVAQDTVARSDGKQSDEQCAREKNSLCLHKINTFHF